MAACMKGGCYAWLAYGAIVSRSTGISYILWVAATAGRRVITGITET